MDLHVQVSYYNENGIYYVEGLLIDESDRKLDVALRKITSSLKLMYPSFRIHIHPYPVD